MAAEYGPYFYLSVFLVIALAFPVGPLMLARLWAMAFAPAKPGEVKSSIYECGLESKGDAWLQLKPEYYLYGILFLVFDVEAVFLFPFAVAFLQLPVGAFVAIMIFLLLLAEGLAWAWVKGILTWR